MAKLSIPRASEYTPNSWMQVKPVTDPQEQLRLEQIHKREAAEARAYATRSYSYGTYDDEGDEGEWEEQTWSWHDDEAWSWAFIPPEATRGSPWYWREPEEEAASTDRPIPAPEPAPAPIDYETLYPTPEGGPTSWGSSHNYNPQTQPSNNGGWAVFDGSTPHGGGWGPAPAPEE